jgi:hypothetical protein
MRDVMSTAHASIQVTPATASQHEGSTLRPLALAGAASLGAGAIHAAAIGVHSEHRQAVYAFTAVAVLQLGWGATAVVRSSRWLALIGAAGNAAILGGWVLAKTSGISFVDGLGEAESVQLADGLAAGLASVAVLVATSVAMSAGLSSARLPLNGVVAALAVAALTVPAMASAGSHTHSGDHAHSEPTAEDEAAHVHAAEVAEDAGSSHAHDDQGSAASGTDAMSTAPGVMHDHGAAVAVTDAELEAATRLVADTKAGVARFGDLEAAKADGYYEVAPPRNGLVHYLNSAYNRDGRILDPERPESLIYLDLTDGNWMLVGAMYRMPAPDQPGPRVGGPLTAWHSHNNLCRAEGRVVAVAVDGACRRGVLGSTPEMLHVWLVENPDGVFSTDMEPTGLLDIVEG